MENIAYPQLVFVHGEKYENQVICNVLSKTVTSFTRIISEFMIETPNMKPTNHPDWIMLVSLIQPRLWNPVTLQSIDLPVLLELKSAACIRRVFLTKTFDHPDCVILLWMKDPRAFLFCYVNGDDDQTWTRKDYTEELVEVSNLDFDDFQLPVECDDDSIFSLSDSIRVNNDAVKPLVIRPVKYKILYSWDPVAPHSKTHLVACCGDMFMIEMGFSRFQDEIHSVIVMKLDFFDMSWNLVDSCPNASFFISGDQALSCPIASVDSNRVGNRVYFISFFKDDDAHNIHKKYSYHIQHKKLEVSLLASPNNASRPYWIRVPNARALEKAEEDYRSGRDGSELDTRRSNSDELLISNINYDGEYYETVLSDLPVEILRIISSYLTNPVDYLSFRAVSKFFCSIGSAKEWKNILGHIDDDDEKKNNPWLMAPSISHKGVYSMVDPITCNKYYTVIPETLDKYSSMCYSSNGRILMHKTVFKKDRRENISQMWLYNPLTKYTICLPKTPKIIEHLLVKAGSVVIGMTLEHYAEFYYTVIEESERELEWYGGRFDEEHEESRSIVQQSNVNVVCAGEFYYLMVEDGNLVYFSEE